MCMHALLLKEKKISDLCSEFFSIVKIPKGA